MSPFDVLGVPPSARPEDCRAAYRRLLSEHHPDRWVAAAPAEQQHHAERLRAVNQAWAALQWQEQHAPPAHDAAVTVEPMPDLDGGDAGVAPAELDDRPLTSAAPGCSLTILPVALLGAAVACFAVSVVLTVSLLWQVAVALALASVLAFLLAPFFVMSRGRQ